MLQLCTTCHGAARAVIDVHRHASTAPILDRSTWGALSGLFVLFRLHRQER